MGSYRCHICEAKSKDEICACCGANLVTTMSERLVIASRRFTHMDYSKEDYYRIASCKAVLTNRRLVIYKIRPEAFNPAFALFKAVANGIRDRPCISVRLEEIEWVRRYGKKHLIKTHSGTYGLCLNDFREWDRHFAPYKKEGER